MRSALSTFALKALRSALVGSTAPFEFRRCDAPVDFEGAKSCDFYLHIPFCKHGCRYCPYNTVPYRKAAVPAYFDALKRELERYAPYLSKREEHSLYIGGGTPTLVLDALLPFLEMLKCHTRLSFIAIETNPESLSQSLLDTLQSVGVERLSVGLQSFDDKKLKALGRSYTYADIKEKLKLLSQFPNTNIDLMFVVGDDDESFLNDVDRAIDLGCNQITAYPLFCFPHSLAGKKERLKTLRMPALRRRKASYLAFCKKMRAAGFHPVSVWGFAKNTQKKFSSVARDYFIGFGAGAASHLRNHFYFNTFNVDAYETRLHDGAFPTALRMELSPRLEDLYWLYWRLYEGAYSATQFQERGFNRSLRFLEKFAEYAHLIDINANEVVLNDQGRFWIHLLQNYYILHYIEKVWGASMQTAFPEKIRL